MKASIHPELHETLARCACGNSFTVASTLPEITSTICSNCHPLYTGEQKFVDVAGRIEKFEKRYNKAAAKAKK